MNDAQFDKVTERLETLERNQEKIIDAQNQIIDLANSLSEMANSFSGSIPAPLAAMFGMGK